MNAIAQIKQWGNSKALRLPTDFARAMDLAIGDNVELTRIDESTIQLVIVPKKEKKRRLSLAERIKKTNLTQLQPLKDWDELMPMGKEL